jgi:hypothetical protein
LTLIEIIRKNLATYATYKPSEKRTKYLNLLETPAGFEPATFSLEDKNHALGRLGLLAAAV